jgi:agmatinase
MATEKPRYRPVDAMLYPRFSGIRTFMRLPQVTDLTDVDFAIVGVPFDTGDTYRIGARFGPEGIRSQSMLLRPFNPALNVAIFDYCSGVDYGDLPVTPGYLPESHAQIEARASAVYASGATPVFLGGDHSVSLPLLRATAKKFGKVALIHFDSHSDLWPGYFGGKDTHGTPFRRAYEEGLIDTSRSIQVGLRGSVYDADDVNMPGDLGFQVITGPELHDMGMKEAIRQIRARVGSAAAYVTFDIDFVDPAYAPGTGTPEVGGFTSAQSLELVRGLAGLNTIGYDVVEVMPPYDPPGGVTCLVAAGVAYEFISLIALKKRNR